VLKDVVDHGGAGLARGMRQLVRDLSRPPRLPRASTRAVRGGREPRGHAGSGRPAHRGLRAHPLRAAQRARARGARCSSSRRRSTSSTSWTSRRAAAWSSTCSTGPAGLHDLLAQPRGRAGHFDLDTYAGAVLEARAAVAQIARQQAVHLAAACSGGIVSACAVAHLAAQRRLAEVASLTLLVCALDNARAGTVSALASRELAAAAVAESARKGYLDGQALAGVFAWLRPNDLIWAYWVNNYLLGRRPPAFDILYWNQDTVRPGRRPAPRLNPDRAGQPARAGGRRDRARHPRRPQRRRRRRLRRRRP
jgi:polyhydroxyalkanoate synthase